MKLSTSTGDFRHYVENTADMIKSYKGTKFRYINLEQTGTLPAFFEESDDGWKRLADDWGNAAAYAGVEFVVSHAPCLEDPDLPFDSEKYQANVRAIRRSIEICHILGIDRIVIHGCTNATNSQEECFAYNRKWYEDYLDLAEKYNIFLLTENVGDIRHIFASGENIRAFLDYMDHPLLGVCWDTAHCNLDKTTREMGQYNHLIALGDKVKALHISDNFGDCHHHTWPFAGTINFDAIMQGLKDINYQGYFNFEASYTLLHSRNLPHRRRPWEHNGETVTKLLNPSIELKKKAVDLLYETGKYLLETYDCFEE